MAQADEDTIVSVRTFVNKLDHNQEEVRLRALDNIINKLNYGIVSSIDLACDRMLIAKLLQWFQQLTSAKQKECLVLLLRICSEEVGSHTMWSLGGLQFLQSLKPDMPIDCQLIIDNIIEQLYIKCHNFGAQGSSVDQVQYPSSSEIQRQMRRPLATKPKSAPDIHIASSNTKLRSARGQQLDDVNPPSASGSNHGKTTPIQAEQEWYSKINRTPSDSDSTGSGFMIVEFPWITLCPTDVHVLDSTNQSLVSQDPQLMMSACEFIVDVMLFDFPAEIFLQRPLIVKTLTNLLNNLTDSHKISDVSLSIVDTLIHICDGIRSRILFHKDPAAFAPKQVVQAGSVTVSPEGNGSSSSTNSSHYSRPSVVGISDEMEEDKTQSTSLDSDGHRSKSSHRSVSVQMTTPNAEEIELQDLQLLLPDFCLSLHKSAISLIEKCNNRLELDLHRLVLKLQNILKLAINGEIWADSSQYAKDLCDLFRLQLHSMARVAVKCHQQATSSSSNQTSPGSIAHKRMSYILLSQLSLDLYSLVPEEHCCDVLGSNERQLLYTLSCDESLGQSLPAIRLRVADILRVVDVGSFNVYKAATVVCSSMDMYCDYLLSSPYTGQDVSEILKLINQTDKAIYSLPYHMNTDIIPSYVKLCAHSWRLLDAGEESVKDYMMNTLLKYLAHPLCSIRRTAYQSVIELLKSSLSFEAPKQHRSEDIRFLTHHSLLWEVACFGLSSEIPEIMSSSQELFNYLMQSRMLVSNELWATVCNALLPILPVIQSYASRDITLGKCILALTDTHFDTNISTVHCVKGALRILFTRDTDARLQATKVLMTELNSLYSSHLLYPLTETKRYENHIIHMESLVRENDAEGTQRAVLTEESVTRVLRVYLADGVESGVKLTSLNQLSVILQNPHTHKYYIEQNGMEITIQAIQESVSPQRSVEEEEAVPPVISILACLLQYNSELRQTLASDLSFMLTLLRCCWLYPTSTRTSVEAAQCLVYIIFDEISPKSSSTLLTLPKTCCVRYKLPLRVLSYCDISTHRVEASPPSNDPITQTLPLQMLRIYWNVAWHGKVEYLLDSIEKQQVNSGSDRFKLTPSDIRSVKESNILYTVFSSLQTITNATSHNIVAQELGTLTSCSLVCTLDGDYQTLSTVTWSTYFHRFLTVEPVAPMDKELLLRILSYFTMLLSLGMPAVTSNVLRQLSTALQSDKDSVLLSLLQDSAYTQPADAPFKRSLQNCLLNILGVAGLKDIAQSGNSIAVDRSRRSYLVCSVLKRLTMADASNFYNLASLESSVYTLLRLTSRRGWSFGCADIDSRSLCTRLIKALFEVLSAFHLGRQGNSLSYMGKGVLRNATLCLRHVIEEITSVVRDSNSWLTPWIEGNEGATRLEWLRSLWSYRDQEVRAAALGVSVALVYSTQGLDTVFNSLTDVVHDAANIVIDSTECSLVRRQAAVLVSNIISTVHRQQVQEADDSAKLVAVCEVLESLNYFEEIFTLLSSDVFIDTELNIDSLHRQIKPEMGDSVCNVVYPTLATPAFLTSVLQGLLLLTKILPTNTLNGLQQVEAIQHLTGFFANSSAIAIISDMDTTDQSRKTLRSDVIRLSADIIKLLRSCIIQNKYMRNKTLSMEGARHVANILSMISCDESGSSDVNSDLIPMWCEFLLYLTAHLHVEESDLTMERLVLPNVVKHWHAFTSHSVRILKTENEDDRICVLEFWTIILGLSYNHAQGETIKELLDKENDDKTESFGRLLYVTVLPLYDSMLLRYSDKDCIQERLSMINCMKSLLAFSQTAKQSALETGLVEGILSHINSFIGKLNLIATQKLGALNESNAYLAELVVSLEMVTNFMLSSDEVKAAMSEVGLANLLHRMWFYCESDAQLMFTCISTLTTYTDNSSLACRHMVCTSTVSCLGMDTDKLQIQSSSLADILVRLTQSQLSKMHLNLELLTKLFKLMCNFALSSDTLSVICKSSLVQGFASSNPKVTIKRKPRLQSALIRLWLQFYVNLSYSLEGQKLILAVPDCVSILIEHLDAEDEGVKEMILITLYNLSVGFRNKILTSDRVPLTALNVLEDSSNSQSTAQCAIEILQAIVYDSMKGKALVKGLSIPEQLEELLSGFKQEESRRKGTSSRNQPDRRSLIESIQQVLVTIVE